MGKDIKTDFDSQSGCLEDFTQDGKGEDEKMVSRRAAMEKILTGAIGAAALSFLSVCDKFKRSPQDLFFLDKRIDGKKIVEVSEREEDTVSISGEKYYKVRLEHDNFSYRHVDINGRYFMSAEGEEALLFNMYDVNRAVKIGNDEYRMAIFFPSADRKYVSLNTGKLLKAGNAFVHYVYSSDVKVIGEEKCILVGFSDYDKPRWMNVETFELCDAIYGTVAPNAL